MIKEVDKQLLQAAIQLLSSVEDIQILDDWSYHDEIGISSLPFQIKCPVQDLSGFIPHISEWVVAVDFREDVIGKVQIYPSASDSGIKTTFKHQMFNGYDCGILKSRSGFICTATWDFNLNSSRVGYSAEPHNLIQRLVWHFERAKEWVIAASQNNLTSSGQIFELPDFLSQFPMGNLPKFLFKESNESYLQWSKIPEKWGLCDLASGNDRKFIALNSFQNPEGQTLLESKWSDGFESLSRIERGIWIRLDKVPVTGMWQVPASLEELDQIVKEDLGVGFDEIFVKCNKLHKPGTPIYACIGFPIPRKIDSSNEIYAWQALELFSSEFSPRRYLSGSELRGAWLKKDRNAEGVNWLRYSQNCTPDFVQARGQISPALSELRVLIVGAGSLGSAIAETLVRMGCHKILICDGDFLEPGNLVRHTLGISSLFENKATALAVSLNSMNFSSQVAGVSLNFTSLIGSGLLDLSTLDLVLDCSGNDQVLRELQEIQNSNIKLIVSVSLSIFASKLFYFSFQPGKFDFQEFQEWFDPFRVEQLEMAVSENVELPRDSGCWNPLLPAPWNRIKILGGLVIEALVKQFNTGQVKGKKMVISIPEIQFEGE